jgi:hypothetical protein
MSASEVLDSGISCGRLFLVREAGNEMTLACWSISDHSRPPDLVTALGGEHQQLDDVAVIVVARCIPYRR